MIRPYSRDLLGPSRRAPRCCPQTARRRRYTRDVPRARRRRRCWLRIRRNDRSVADLFSDRNPFPESTDAVIFPPRSQELKDTRDRGTGFAILSDQYDSSAVSLFRPPHLSFVSFSSAFPPPSTAHAMYIAVRSGFPRFRGFTVLRPRIHFRSGPDRLDGPSRRGAGVSSSASVRRGTSLSGDSRAPPS